MDVILAALGDLFTPYHLMIMSVATILGIVAGALPGITATMAVALIVPFTFTMTPVAGLIAIAALYTSTIFAGCIPSILLNTPGTPSSIATCFDGYPMARQGRGEEAIYSATFASFVGGIFGAMVLVACALPLAKVALRFGPPEIFWVAIFGMTIIASLSGESLIKGIAGGVLGMMIGMVGIAPVGGDVRFDLGIPSFQGGIELISVLIGFFCIPELLRMAFDPNVDYEQMQVKEDEEDGAAAAALKSKESPLKLGWHNVMDVKNWGNVLRSCVIGAVIGVLPGVSGSIANLVAYSEAKRAAKDPETFGKGNVQGIVATESSNNALVGGAMVPLLTLGVPGSPPAAIIYGTLLLHGLSPGPELFTSRGDITYVFLLSFFVASAMVLIFGLPAGKAIYKIVIKIPTRVLVPSILLLTVVGSYAIRSNEVDVIVMFIFGIIGYIVKEWEFSGGPIVLGLILGPFAEKGYVQGLIMGNAVSTSMPWLIFFTRPVCLVLIVLSLLSVSWPLIRMMMQKRNAARAAQGGAS